MDATVPAGAAILLDFAKVRPTSKAVTVAQTIATKATTHTTTKKYGCIAREH